MMINLSGDDKFIRSANKTLLRTQRTEYNCNFTYSTFGEVKLQKKNRAFFHATCVHRAFENFTLGNFLPKNEWIMIQERVDKFLVYIFWAILKKRETETLCFNKTVSETSSSRAKWARLQGRNIARTESNGQLV